MVQCDKCDRWYHFQCVNVSADIEDKDWVCVRCQEMSSHRESPSTCSKKTTSTTRQRRIDLDLQRLEEARALEKERDEKYLKQKYNLLESMQSLDSDSVKSASSKSGKQVEEWLHRQEGNKFEQQNARRVKTALTLQATRPTYSLGIEAHSTYIAKQLPPQTARNVTEPARSERANAFQRRQNVYKEEEAQPNPLQIANRHSMTKELPNFHGNPEEWPLFISSFERSTRLCGFSNEENLLRLQRSLKGRALDSMRGRLMMPSNVPSIMNSLKIMYGRPRIIMKTLLQKVRAEPKVNIEKVETVVSYSLAVQNLISTMEACELYSYLDNAELVEELVEKLPTQLMLDWATFTEGLQYFNLTDFNEWLVRLIDNICRVNPGRCFDVDAKGQPRKTEKGHINAHTEDTRQEKTNSLQHCVACNQFCNGIYDCKRFQSMSIKDRWEIVKQNKLCRTCLSKHDSRCPITNTCGINNCTYRHHRLLHKSYNEARIESSANAKQNSRTDSIQTKESATTERRPFNCNAHGSVQHVTYRVVPVILYSDHNQVETFAFLDEGSSLTMMEESLADELQLEGKTQPLYLKWTGDAHRSENESRIVSTEISGTSKSSKRFTIPIIRTVKSLSLPIQSLDMKQLSSRFSYLRGYPIESYEKAIPRMLIGLDNLKLAVPMKVIEGGEGDPVATKTRLGWVVYGPSVQPNEGDSAFAFNSFHECECKRDSDESLQNMMKEYFSLDSLGVTNICKSIRSKDEERACHILETKTIRKGNRFQTSLLWKYDHVKLPDSFHMALRRHNCFMRKLNSNPELKTNLTRQITEYLNKGYIRKLSKEELQIHSPRTWYLPIFVVTNQNKPGKTRIVWDAAAEVHGVSLNSVLLKGPDQLVPLLSVLFRFQERKIALCADIREMFHQILVTTEDQQAQRFLWSNDPDNKPEVYVMQVLTFGATCSPSCAQFVKNQNAREFIKEHPRAVNSILESHYVDDLLDSVDTEKEAIKLAKEIQFIHKCGGFDIRNWISNSRAVLEAIGEMGSESKRNLDMNSENTAEKILGMWWCMVSDTFTYILSPKASTNELLSGDVRPTKRQVLRVLMTIFDPLGLIANYLIYIKILMQEIWRTKLEWDEAIDDNLYEKWCLWVHQIKNISNIRIPRCYFNNIKYGDHESCQLHVFVDASINAFAAVAYVRVTKGEESESRIIMSKTRVAPLTLTSIPRLELEAARLGARLAKTIRESHTIKFNKTFYWSDSKTVLAWIQSDHRNYKQFVGFRVSEILETTATNQWRYVPTKENVADEATKWQKIPKMDGSERWFVGPKFLIRTESEWPINLNNIEMTSEELKPSVLFHHSIYHKSLVEHERHSSWKRLVRTQAFVSRFIWNIRAKRKSVVKRNENHITQEEYQLAENLLYQQAQLDSYKDEIALLKTNMKLSIELRKPLEKSSPIYKSSPYIDQHGVLRLRGRIDAVVGIPPDTKRPILLPKGHHITELIIKEYHEKFHHHNNETVLNEIHKKFSIPNLRAAIKSVRKNCQFCKNATTMPKPPEMGDLPPARLSSFTRPFTFVGLDYFGPMHVTVGRRTEKRWGVIITCMTTRAIHLEISNSLTSDSCILAIKRFIARRGIPKEIRCDNGTNFHGAEKELQEALRKQQNDLAREFSSSQTKWTFNPPASPHMGGSWERLIQSVKKTLYRILPSRNPSDELLHSMLIEVERTINSRPLTYVALENDSDEVLTPNHFLLGSSNGEKSDAINTDNTLLRRNWMKSQQFANAFWNRWVREYLPTITRRTRWFQPVKPISVGDIVLIADEANPRNLWPKGKVIEVKPGKDGQVRRATVQTTTGIYERPAVKLAVLDVQKDKSSSKPEDRLTGGSINASGNNDNCHATQP